MHPDEFDFHDNVGESCPICAQGIFELETDGNNIDGMIMSVRCNHCQFQMERYVEIK